MLNTFRESQITFPKRKFYLIYLCSLTPFYVGGEGGPLPGKYVAQLERVHRRPIITLNCLKAVNNFVEEQNLILKNVRS